MGKISYEDKMRKLVLVCVLFGIRCELFYTLVKFPSVFLFLWGLCKCCIAAFNVSINYCYYYYYIIIIILTINSMLTR